MDQITLGDVSVTRVKEYYGTVEMDPATFFPESPRRFLGQAPGLAGPGLLEPRDR